MDHLSGQQYQHKYARVSISFAFAEVATAGRFGSAAIQGTTVVGQMWLGVSTTTVSKFICGLGFNTASSSGASIQLLRFMHNSVAPAAVHFTAAKNLVLYCGSAGSVTSTAASYFGNSSWNWLEMDAYWHST